MNEYEIDQTDCSCWRAKRPSRLFVLWRSALVGIVATTLMLADAIRADERGFIAADQWPAECRNQSQEYVPVTPAAIAQARQTLQQRMHGLEKILPPPHDGQDSWKAFLFWPATLNLTTTGPPAPAELDRLERRWFNAPNVWNHPEVVETSLAARSCIRLLRASLVGESPEQHAAAWNELAGLLEARPSAADSEPARVCTMVEQRERLGQESSLTRSIRREIARPDLIVTIDPKWLQSQFAGKIDEAYQVNAVIAGARTTGSGRMLGRTTCELLSSSGVGRWIVRFDGVSSDAAIGQGDGVRVRSHATTRLHSDKSYTLDARGLSSQPAVVTAETAIEYNDISANGGPVRRRLATRQTYARRTQAKTESEALARQSLALQTNKVGDELIAKFNQNVWANFRDPLILADRLAPEARVFSDSNSWRYECYLDHSAPLAAPSDREFGVDAQAVLRLTAPALEELAIARLGGRRYNGEQFARALDKLLGRPPRAPSVDQDFQLEFARHPCDFSFDDGQIGMTFHLTSFESSDVRYPAMTVNAQYRVEQRGDGLAMVRQGGLTTKALAANESEVEPVVSGRQQMLHVAVRRKLNKVLADELLLSRSDASATSQVPPLHIKRVSVDDGWLQIAFGSDGASQDNPAQPKITSR